MKIVHLIQKRPTDTTIRIARILFGVLFVGIMWYNLIFLPKSLDTNYFFGTLVLNENQLFILEYIFIAIGLIPIFMGAVNICLLKKKYMRIVQIIFGILLFYIASSIQDSAELDFDILIGFMGFFPLFAGITGKCITKDCLKYKEKITKIRI